MKKKILIVLAIFVIIAIIGVCVFVMNYKKPENVLTRYISLISEGRYYEL